MYLLYVVFQSMAYDKLYLTLITNMAMEFHKDIQLLYILYTYDRISNEPFCLAERNFHHIRFYSWQS